MFNNKYLRSFLGLFTLVLCMFGIQTAVHAETYTVPMQVLENGSSNTSYAAAYFSHSATVTPNNNNTYTITSTVTTGKDLGNYPVQVLNIDGSGANVSRGQSGNSQTITYSFVTSNLSARHNAAIKVDVNSINYHHNYIVGLVLDASKVPATPSASSSSKPAVSSSSQQISSQPSSSSVTTSSVSEPVASSSSQSNETDTSTARSKSSFSTKSTSKSETKTKVAKEKHKDQDKQLPVVAIIGGGLALGIILGLVFNLKKKK